MVETQVLRRWLFFMEYLDFCDSAWIKPTSSKEAWPDETGAEERNVNYFTCPVSTVDIGGGLLKSDV